jgi:hypothetical protein
MWRNIRIAVLLLILLFVALNTYFDRVYATDWNIPLRVAVFPINADRSDIASAYIAGLRTDDFRQIEAFFAEEAGAYDLGLEHPIRVTLAPELREIPPSIAPGTHALGVAWWSLKTRFWAWRHGSIEGGASDIKLFALFHDPQRTSVVPHSIGMQKGLFGIVHLFADAAMQGANDTVLAHELLHTLGATDKYDPMTSLPIHPHGYAEPTLQPLLPQRYAELMGGRIPLARDRAEIPESLEQVLIGPQTASEIGWTKR